jgi:hypothetical protein
MHNVQFIAFFIITLFTLLYVKVGILLTYWKHWHDRIISLSREVCARKTSMALPHFIEVSVLSLESEWSCICVVEVSIASFYDFSIGFFYVILIFLRVVLNYETKSKRNETKYYAETQRSETKYYEAQRNEAKYIDIFTDFKENRYNIKIYINHKTVNAVYTIFCKSYDRRGRSSNTITNLVIIKQ